MPIFSRLACFISIFVLSHSGLGAVQFIFINGDGPGEGLNDPTPITPVGGNPGTTVGAQRLAALERVGQIWGSYIDSAVPIRVFVEFDPLGTNVLASAGPSSVQYNFSKAPKKNIWYSVGLANQLQGTDLEPAENDIDVTASSNGSFYYGFDNVTPTSPNLNNFVNVLLHELGHGLGFLSLVNESTGTLASGLSDVFTDLIFDREVNLGWPAMTNAQRAASAKNDPDLLWNGQFTTAAIPYRLGIFNLTATYPNLSTQPMSIIQADFSGPIPAAGLTGDLAITAPADACGPITNAAALAGKIAFIRRGTCDFDTKAYKAQQAGAIAVILANNVAETVTPGGDEVVDGVEVDIVIPVLSVSKADGDALLAASPGVKIAISPTGQFSGTADNKLRLYAPAVLEPGSSVSHWTTDATPNLLMEPIINPMLDRKLDLTLTQMRDIGWKIIDIPYPYLTFTSWKSLVFLTTDTLTGPNDDPDRDGVDNLEEYFFGTDPKKSDVSRLPTFQLAAGVGKFSYTRSKLFTDLTFGLEKSTMLNDFTPAVLGTDYEVESIQSLSTSAEKVTLRILNQATGKSFYRLRINR